MAWHWSIGDSYHQEITQVGIIGNHRYRLYFCLWDALIQAKHSPLITYRELFECRKKLV